MVHHLFPYQEAGSSVALDVDSAHSGSHPVAYPEASQAEEMKACCEAVSLLDLENLAAYLAAAEESLEEGSWACRDLGLLVQVESRQAEVAFLLVLH